MLRGLRPVRDGGRNFRVPDCPGEIEGGDGRVSAGPEVRRKRNAMSQSKIIVAASTIAAATQALTALSGAEGDLIPKLASEGRFDHEAAASMAAAQTQNLIRKARGQIATALRIDEELLAEGYTEVAQTYLQDSTDNPFISCYNNCHSACHGSRGWR